MIIAEEGRDTVKVLVAGGSRFIGRHLVEFLLADGHDVTLFNRGVSGPGLFPDATQISGDRAEPPEELSRNDWDWVFDLSCYTQAAAESLVRTVGPRTGRYVFCSTGSVYDWDGTPTPMDEEETPTLPATPENTGENAPAAVAYGARKRGAEEAVLALAPEVGMEATIVRPCLVYGPWDATDRLHYWLHRVREGGVVIPAGGTGKRHQIYVKDLARLFLAAAKAVDATGRIYNAAATRPAGVMDWIRASAAVLGKEPVIREVAWDDLKAAGVTSLPGAMPAGSDRVFSTRRIERDFGFTATPFVQTVAESLEHMAREGRPVKEAIPLEWLNRFLGA